VLIGIAMYLIAGIIKREGKFRSKLEIIMQMKIGIYPKIIITMMNEYLNKLILEIYIFLNL
jgi:hypothetical protein